MAIYFLITYNYESQTHRNSPRLTLILQGGGKVPELSSGKYLWPQSALIYSTKVTAHYNQSKIKSLMVITKHHLWLEEENSKKKRISTPLSALRDIIKAE